MCEKIFIRCEWFGCISAGKNIRSIVLPSGIQVGKLRKRLVGGCLSGNLHTKTCIASMSFVFRGTIASKNERSFLFCPSMIEDNAIQKLDDEIPTCYLHTVVVLRKIRKYEIAS